MRHEGMGRRYSDRDWRIDEEDQRQQAVREQKQQKNRQLVKDLLAIDMEGKALTGRKMDAYVENACVQARELFPDEADILNIGDPWQTIDRDRVINLEYETGGVSSFTFGKNAFGESRGELFPHLLQENLRYMGESIFSLRDDFPALYNELYWRYNAVQETYKRHTIHDYPRMAKILNDMRRILGERKKDPSTEDNDDTYNNGNVLRDLWYSTSHLARGLEDIYYVKTVIEPRVAQEDQSIIGGLSEQERAELIARLVEDFRGQKTYEFSELKKGVFPDTDFADKSFDRILASWSISAHMFGVMNERQFDTVFDEFDRLIKKDGAAYIWPVGYHFADKVPFLSALSRYCLSGGAAALISEGNDGPSIMWLDPRTNIDDFALQAELYVTRSLVLLPRDHNPYSKKRIAGSLYDRYVEKYGGTREPAGSSDRLSPDEAVDGDLESGYQEAS